MSCCFSIVKCLLPWRVRESEYDVEMGLQDERNLSHHMSMHRNLAQVNEPLDRLHFLPAGDPLASLTYLTLFQHADDINFRSPFPFLHDQVFQMSDQATTGARRWLWYGGTTSILLTGGSIITGGWINGVSSTAMYALSLITGTIGSIASVLSTGTYPDVSSNYANKKQDHFHEVENIYEAIAFKLVELSFDQPELAQSIANRLKLKKIDQALEGRITRHEADCLIDPLKEAKNYLKKSEIPIHSKVLKLYIDYRNQGLEIEKMRQQMNDVLSDHLKLKKRIRKIEKNNE
jgi:hypothetical protein